MLATALPNSKSDLVGLALDEANVHVDMADILGERRSWARHLDKAGLDFDSDTFRDLEFFGLEDVPHLCKVTKVSVSSKLRPSDPSPQNASLRQTTSQTSL